MSDNETVTDATGDESAVDPAVVGLRIAAALDEPRWESVTADLISGGKSNLTYELRSEAGSLILRRPPTGALLPSAHDMAREVRVQRALDGTAVPVPRIVCFDEDGTDLGVPYYVMEKVDGTVVRDQFPAGLGQTTGERSAIAGALVDTLASIHQIVPEEVGLGSFGRPSGFMTRQVARWADQWERSRTHAVPEIDQLIDLLRGIEFSASPSAVVHGDYRLDNCMLGHDPLHPVAAVIDWELSTLGDALADLGMLLFYWCEAGEAEPLLTPGITALDGFPSRTEVADRYFSKTADRSEELPAFVAFAHLKFAVIAQGIALRTREGAMAGQDFGNLDDEVLRIATQGLDRFTKKEI